MANQKDYTIEECDIRYIIEGHQKRARDLQLAASLVGAMDDTRQNLLKAANAEWQKSIMWTKELREYHD